MAAQERSAEDVLGFLRKKSGELFDAITGQDWAVAEYVVRELMVRVSEFQRRYSQVLSPDAKDDYGIVADHISVICWTLSDMATGADEGLSESQRTRLRARAQDVLWKLSGVLGQLQAIVNGHGG